MRPSDETPLRTAVSNTTLDGALVPRAHRRLTLCNTHLTSHSSQRDRSAPADLTLILSFAFPSPPPHNWVGEIAPTGYVGASAS